MRAVVQRHLEPALARTPTKRGIGEQLGRAALPGRRRRLAERVACVGQIPAASAASPRRMSSSASRAGSVPGAMRRSACPYQEAACS